METGDVKEVSQAAKRLSYMQTNKEEALETAPLFVKKRKNSCRKPRKMTLPEEGKCDNMIKKLVGGKQ